MARDISVSELRIKARKGHRKQHFRNSMVLLRVLQSIRTHRDLWWRQQRQYPLLSASSRQVREEVTLNSLFSLVIHLVYVYIYFFLNMFCWFRLIFSFHSNHHTHHDWRELPKNIGWEDISSLSIQILSEEDVLPGHSGPWSFIINMSSSSSNNCWRPKWMNGIGPKVPWHLCSPVAPSYIVFLIIGKCGCDFLSPSELNKSPFQPQPQSSTFAF